MLEKLSPWWPIEAAFVHVSRRDRGKQVCGVHTDARRLDQQKTNQMRLPAKSARVWQVFSKRSASQPITASDPAWSRQRRGKKRSNGVNIRGRVRMPIYTVRLNSERPGLTEDRVVLLRGGGG